MAIKHTDKLVMLQKALDHNAVQCNICSRKCAIPKGAASFCRTKVNDKGKLYSTVYGKACSLEVDPIEKKPLFHFMPGTDTFSISTVGCNFRCQFCQNYSISQVAVDDVPYYDAPPKEVVAMAQANKCQSIAYTYTEPTVYIDYAWDCMKLAAKRGLKNVFVTNGWMTEECLDRVSKHLHAVNVDIKGDHDFYREICSASLEPVLESIRRMKEKGIHVEVTNLIVPGRNDDLDSVRMIADFVKGVDEEMPLHFTTFYPTYLMTDVERTPRETLVRAREAALERGVKYVFCGNTYPGDPYENTYCPGCGALIVKRHGFSVVDINLKRKKCPECGVKIPIVK